MTNTTTLSLPVAAELKDDTILFRVYDKGAGRYALRVSDRDSNEPLDEYPCDDLSLSQVLARAVKCFVAEWDGACSEGQMFNTIIKQFTKNNDSDIL